VAESRLIITKDDSGGKKDFNQAWREILEEPSRHAVKETSKKITSGRGNTLGKLKDPKLFIRTFQKREGVLDDRGA